VALLGLVLADERCAGEQIDCRGEHDARVRLVLVRLCLTFYDLEWTRRKIDRDAVHLIRDASQRMGVSNDREPTKQGELAECIQPSAQKTQASGRLALQSDAVRVVLNGPTELEEYALVHERRHGDRRLGMLHHTHTGGHGRREWHSVHEDLPIGIAPSL